LLTPFGATFPFDVPVNELLALVLFEVCAASVVVGVIVIVPAAALEISAALIRAMNDDFKTYSPGSLYELAGDYVLSKKQSVDLRL
jgi:hypothetical protein